MLSLIKYLYRRVYINLLIWSYQVLFRVMFAILNTLEPYYWDGSLQHAQRLPPWDTFGVTGWAHWFEPIYENETNDVDSDPDVE